MSFGFQNTNRFSLLDHGAQQAAAKQLKQPAQKVDKKQIKKIEAEAKAKAKAQARAQAQEASKNDDGFTAVDDKRRKPTKFTGQTRKRNFDRHVSGTGRGKEMKKKGQGKGNWGNAVEVGLEDAEGQLNKRRNNRRNNRPRKPKVEKPEEKKELTEEEKQRLEEEEKLRKEEEEKRRKEEEEEKRLLTLDQYLKKQKQQRPKLKKQRRRAETGDDGKFKPITKEESEELIQLEKKTVTGPKEKKGKKEKRLDVTEFLKDAPKPSRGPRKSDHPRGGRGGRGRRAPAPQSQPNLKDEQSFPSLG